MVSGRWGFDVRDITVPTQMWHGELDRIVPLKTARKMAEALQDCRLNIVPGAGHVLLFHCWREILCAVNPENYLSRLLP